MEDRRESVRISCRLEVESKIFGEKWFILYSKNIGIDGMMLTCESEIEKLKALGIDTEKNVFLSFYLPDDQNNVVKISGEVVYVGRETNPVDGSEASFIGIRFKDISDHANKQLNNFISSKDSNIII